MTGKKYEILSGNIIHKFDATLFRIKALRDFGTVKAGDLGGYIERESNLSQTGNCWVSHESMVWGDAHVINDAIVDDYAHINGDALIKDRVTIREYAVVTDDANISGDATIDGYSLISGNSNVGGYAYISGRSRIFGSPNILGNPKISGNTNILDRVTIEGNACIDGDIILRDHVRVCDDAIIKGDIDISGWFNIVEDINIASNDQLLRIDYITCNPMYLIYHNKKIRVQCSTFDGDIEEFERLVKTLYNDENDLQRKNYLDTIQYVRKIFMNRFVE